MSIRRASEDVKLRPFLSSHFDDQAYLRSVIENSSKAASGAGGGADDALKEIVNFVGDVNEEIKGYISEHKNELMAGMQDVAVLAQRYQTLSFSSDKLVGVVQRLKKEASTAHETIGKRTEELHRLHATNALLKQVRQFIHAKSQLDQHLKASSHDGKTVSESFLSDIRYAATAARTISELETLLNTDTTGLMGVAIVKKDVKMIRNFAGVLRSAGQERLLLALSERNQASLASALQIFFNLQSLPEILILAIKKVCEECIDLSRTALNLKGLVTAHQELGEGNGFADGRDLRSSVARLSALGRKSARADGPHPLDKGNLVQQRVAMRELAHVWAMQIHDKALQINALQRVVSKKEDPTTNRKFSSVLLDCSSDNEHLRNCELLDLFWEYLARDMQGLAAELLKANPIAASRVYPSLRRMSSDIMHSIALISTKETAGFSSGPSAGSSSTRSVGLGGAYRKIAASSYGIFGSRSWDDSGAQGLSLEGPSLWGLEALGGLDSKNTFTAIATVTSSSNGPGVTDRDASSLFSQADGSLETVTQRGLVLGLKPLRDKYLGNAHGRMTGPVLQMFPEIDGYTAAVPSKRDLMEFFKVVELELSSCLIEGDLSFIFDVCKEVRKVSRLLVTKAEGMVASGAEAMRMSHDNGFARTSKQEHNHQLIGLLCHLKDVFDRMPNLVMKNAQNAPGSVVALSGGAGMSCTGTSSDASTEVLRVRETAMKELRGLSKMVTTMVDEVVTKQLLPQIVSAMTSYTRSQLVGLLSEGIAITPSSSREKKDSVECSRAIQLLSTNIPDMIKVHISQLPKENLVKTATIEFCLRVMCTYVSVGALVRPVTEQSRLRIAKDMAALEVILASAHPIDKQSSPVTREFRAFRQLLFSEESPSSHSPVKSRSGKTGAQAGTSDIPSREAIFLQPFAADLRPSTLLGHLAACAPNQMPSPHASGKTSALSYIALITTPDGSATTSGMPSVQSLYVDSQSGQKWNDIAAEQKTIDVVRECLDIFIQRTAVADASLRSNLRGWYEAIVDVTGHYYQT